MPATAPATANAADHFSGDQDAAGWSIQISYGEMSWLYKRSSCSSVWVSRQPDPRRHPILCRRNCRAYSTADVRQPAAGSFAGSRTRRRSGRRRGRLARIRRPGATACASRPLTRSQSLHMRFTETDYGTFTSSTLSSDRHFGRLDGAPRRFGAGARRPGRGGVRHRREPCHRHARDAEIPGRLPAFRLCQPEGAEGRQPVAGGPGHLRQPESLHRQGHGGERGRADLRHADAAGGRRTVHALSAACGIDPLSARPVLGRVHAQSGGALARRQAGDRRGCDFLDEHPAQAGPAVLPLLFPRHRPNGADRAAFREIHLPRRYEPGIAADRRRRPEHTGSAGSRPAGGSNISGSRIIGAGTCRRMSATTIST